MMLAWLGLAVVGVVVVGLRALANGYLMVLYSRRRSLVLLEYGADDRYHSVGARKIPIALVRYLGLCTLFSILLAWRRVLGLERPKVALTAKV